MNTPRILIFFFLATFLACNQGDKKPPGKDPEAKALNDSALKILMKSSSNEDYERAIGLLDKAIAIDSTYVGAYRRKLSFETILKQYDKALVTAKKLNSLRPENPSFVLTTGILYEKLRDTISSLDHFKRALPMFDKILDTMSSGNEERFAVTMNKGITYILLKQQKMGNDILKELYAKPPDQNHKEYLIPLIDKPREEVINYLTLEQKQ